MKLMCLITMIMKHMYMYSGNPQNKDHPEAVTAKVVLILRWS